MSAMEDERFESLLGFLQQQRGFGEIAVFGHRHECAYLIELHGPGAALRVNRTECELNLTSVRADGKLPYGAGRHRVFHGAQSSATRRARTRSIA